MAMSKEQLREAELDAECIQDKGFRHTAKLIYDLVAEVEQLQLFEAAHGPLPESWLLSCVRDQPKEPANAEEA